MYIISNDYKIKLKQLFNIDCDDLCLLKVKYYDFNNKVQNGEIICNKIIYNDLEEIFKELYNNKYQIEKIKLIDEYNYNDILSMEDDNTSCFNYRKILGTDKLSMHSYGLAIDINPLYNPYILEDNSILPSNGREYADRKKAFKHKIDENDLCYKLFIEHGFIWGGNWEYPDYQHFERRKNVNQDKYIYSELLSKHLDIINLFTKKPFNFRKNIVPIEIINENYSVIEKDCNYKFRKIIKPIQNHTNKVEIVTESNIENEFNEVDGLITDLKGVALVTSLADCQGILLYDPVKKVIGNIHSGWKGTLNKIVVNAVNIMINDFNCNPKDIIAYITPSIGKCCFEVDEDVKALFLENYNNIEDDIYVGEIKDNKQKYYIDTLSINKKNLLELGLLEKNIEIAGICTKCNSNILHSYRSEKENSGRNIALICMKI